jgi:hypothetical protein
MALQKIPVSYLEKDAQSLCPLPPGWRLVVLIRSGMGPWQIKEDPMLALTIVRGVEVANDLHPHYEKDAEMGRPDYTVDIVTSESLDGYRQGSGGFTAEDQYSDHAPYHFDSYWTTPPEHRYVAIVVGTIPPGSHIRDGDEYVQAAERIIRDYDRNQDQASQDDSGG